MAGKLRPGNVHSAEDWDELLLPEVERQQSMDQEVVFRADAACSKPEIYEALEERGVKYAIRLPANDNLLRDIEELLTRPGTGQGSGTESLKTKKEGAVCEKSTRNDLDHAVQPKMAQHRSAFRSQMQLRPCDIAHEQYDWRHSELKKEIPAHNDGMNPT